jgi:hypothetical protein
VRAAKFEFEKRFWRIAGIYPVGFSLSSFEHTSFILALRHLISPGRIVSARFARSVIMIGPFVQKQKQ